MMMFEWWRRLAGVGFSVFGALVWWPFGGSEGLG